MRAALALGALASLSTTVIGVAAPWHVQCRFHDPRIDEASGLAIGQASPGVAYVQNDSGDTNRFFAINLRTGRTAATITVRGAHNVDWEDIALAPSPAGTSSVWLADIGDNGAVRREVAVYRVPEPKVRFSAHNASITTPRASMWRLRYPHGPVDAEAFAVTPTGVGYIVTKSATGRSVVYRLPPHPDRVRVQTLIRVGRVRFSAGLSFGRLATGAAISRDGRWLAIRTYLGAYFWRLHGGDVAAALAGRRREVGLPLQVQGEGIALGPGVFYVDAEGRHSPVYSVRFEPLEPRQFPHLPPPPTSAAPSAARSAPDSGHTGWLLAASVAAAALACIGAVTAYRRRRSR